MPHASCLMPYVMVVLSNNKPLGKNVINNKKCELPQGFSRSPALRGNAVTACYVVLFAPQRGEKAFPRSVWERVDSVRVVW